MVWPKMQCLTLQTMYSGVRSAEWLTAKTRRNIFAVGRVGNI